GNTVLQFLLKGLPRGMAQPVYSAAPIAAPMGHPTVAVAMPGPGLVSNAPTSQPTTVIPAQGTTPSLVITEGPMMGQRFPVGGPLEIGREANGIRLSADSSASRRHASVSPGPNGLVMQDLGSTNGTYVNGMKLMSATLRPGDLVKIGATTFRVE
ncbi:MAG: FHA domain-containing protein, partial [Armatimonadota bacterium]